MRTCIDRIPLDILERRQAERLEHLAELQQLIALKQREIDNLRNQPAEPTRFDNTVHKFTLIHGYGARA